MARNSLEQLWANVMITTACDRACPDCCCGDVVLRAKGRVFSPESIAAEVRALGPVARVYITGGEPTLHPQFEQVARLAHEARGGLPLYLVTNGFRLAEKADAARYFDHIDWSRFDAASNAGAPTDPEIGRRYLARAPAGAGAFSDNHIVHTRTQGSGVCGRETFTVSVMAGRVYGCCVACGIEGAESTELSPGWLDRLGGVALPCDRCVFGEPATGA